jgi:hypothetical protein
MLNKTALAIEATLLLEYQELDCLIRKHGIDPCAPKSGFDYEYGQLAEKWPELHADLEAGRDIGVIYAVIRGSINRLWDKTDALAATTTAARHA